MGTPAPQDQVFRAARASSSEISEIILSKIVLRIYESIKKKNIIDKDHKDSEY